MNIIKRKGRVGSMVGMMLLAAVAVAQDATTQTVAEQASSLRQMTDKFPGGSTGLIVLVVLALVGVGAAVLMGSRKRDEHGETEMYPEPTMMESTKFEQLLAETQGLFLRIQGGESKGYYRKIEQLARIFLERMGVSGARQMPYEEIQALLSGGSFSQKQSGELMSIFERCKQGAEHEGEKIDFTAAELIKDLRSLIKQAAEETSPRLS